MTYALANRNPIHACRHSACHTTADTARTSGSRSLACTGALTSGPPTNAWIAAVARYSPPATAIGIFKAFGQTIF